MKKTQITCLTLASILLVSSCTSSRQAAGGVTGAMIGGRVGELVGIAAGHGPFRGGSAALGGLIGMGVGAVVGVGVTSQIENNERGRSHNPSERQGVNERRTTIEPDYQTSGRAYAQESNPTTMSELTYMDVTGDGAISKDETIELESYITNNSENVLNDIVISLTISDTKNFIVSPPLTTTLQPGQKIRYTGRVHCKKAHRGNMVKVNLTTNLAGKVNTTGSVYIRTK